MINSTVNHSYDSRDDFNSTIEIIMRFKIPMESFFFFFLIYFCLTDIY